MGCGGAAARGSPAPRSPGRPARRGGVPVAAAGRSRPVSGAAPLEISSRVADALRAGWPVVALESTLIAHGLPWPLNLETAREAEAA
ncbi:MAG TPA: pseudouridine-5'-phosphate glycosidase, partial [Dongiaceae bacterium]|nr:pseudouridine-5'-phosphate glycosidase [Dongiaceae bacterium]